jgi:hypothetical protein
VAGIEQPLCHAAAHDAETDKAEIRHGMICPLSLPEVRVQGYFCQ